MSRDDDIRRLQLQEERLRFEGFDEAQAWELGCRLRDEAVRLGVALHIEVRINAHTVFRHAMPGTAPANADWARRKRNTSDLTQRSSYAIGLELAAAGSDQQHKMGLPQRDYAAHGGSFPLRLRSGVVIGTVTVSGAPQRQDHAILVGVLAAMTGESAVELQLAD